MTLDRILGKINYLATIFFLIVFVLPFRLHATADGPDFYRVINVKKGDSLNLRSRPSEKSSILLKIPFNARGISNEVKTADKTGKIIPESDAGQLNGSSKPVWREVTYANTKGWVNIRFLAVDSEESSFSEADFHPNHANAYAALPADARFFFRRAFSCGEYSSYSIGEAKPKDQAHANMHLKVLKCDQIDQDSQAIRAKYKGHSGVQRAFQDLDAAG